MTDKEIERLQSAYLRAVTERDNAIFQLTRLKAERDRAVEDLTLMANVYKDCGGCVNGIGNCVHTGNCYKWRKER